MQVKHIDADQYVAITHIAAFHSMKTFNTKNNNCATNTFYYLCVLMAMSLLSMQHPEERVQDLQVTLTGMIHATTLYWSPTKRSSLSGSLHHVASHQGQIPHFSITNTAWKKAQNKCLSGVKF